MKKERARVWYDGRALRVALLWVVYPKESVMSIINRSGYERVLTVKYMAKKSDMMVRCNCCMQEYRISSWLECAMHWLTCSVMRKALCEMSVFVVTACGRKQ